MKKNHTPFSDNPSLLFLIIFLRFAQLVKQTKSPSQFWVIDGKEWPELQVAATRIFGLLTSSAAERNFSTMGFLHTKLRNRLSQAVVNKLVFVRTNHLLCSAQVNFETSSDEEDLEIVEQSDSDCDI